MRTTKDITGLGEVCYVYENGLLIQMDYLDYIYDFSYDANGTPIGFRYTTPDGTTSQFYYGVNSRGDIIAIYNSYGIKVATYSYDAYGKPLDTDYTIPRHSFAVDNNPLRYRGYVYDRETGFYYLQTRYYDPATCRFINADGQLNTDSFIGYNMFAYCSNNPIKSYDPNGAKEFECCPHGNCSNCNKSFWEETFGAESSSVTKVKEEREIIFWPLSNFFTIKTGISTTKINSKSGDASRPISVYAQYRIDNPWLSSAGINFNANDNRLSLNLGLDNIGLTGYSKISNYTFNFGYVADLSQLKLGVEYGFSRQFKNIIRTNYTNISITGKGLYALYSLMVYGQYIPTTTPSPSGIPAPT